MALNESLGKDLIMGLRIRCDLVERGIRLDSDDGLFWIFRLCHLEGLDLWREG